MDDAHDLKRFLDAQISVFETARSELLAGRKRTHWMWFIFPQIAGLGHSATSRHFAIASRNEAVAFLAHPVLGDRLCECTRIVSNLDGLSAYEIFGDPDCIKFHSCMTLFAETAVDDVLFKEALMKYFDGKPDLTTIEKLAV